MRRIIASVAFTLLMSPVAALAQSAEPSPTSSPSPSGVVVDTDTNAGGDTAAVAVNTRDGADVFRFAFMIRRTMHDVVDIDNAAVAFASCTECQTVAVSFQVVLILSDPDVVTTDNLALAMNVECTLCETLASAYQFVLTTGGPVYFTAEGNQALASIRMDIIELMRSDLPIEEVLARLDELQARLADVLANELVSAGPPPTEPVPASPSSGATPSPSGAPSTDTTDSPTSDPSPSPSESPS